MKLAGGKKSVIVGQLRRAQTEELLAKAKRQDGRGLIEHRAISIELGVIEKANGSARVKLGDTEVVAGVKIETGRPFPDTPDQGLLIVTAEVLPVASPFAEPGPPDESAIELARVSDRGVRESGMVDFSKLVLKSGELAYSVFVDVAVLNEDGNLFDATNYAIVAALATSTMPKYKLEGEKFVAAKELGKLPIETIPVATTFAKIGDKVLLDPNSEEEALMDCRLTLVTDSSGNYVAGQKGNPGLFSIEEFRWLASTAKEKGEEIRTMLRKVTGTGA